MIDFATKIEFCELIIQLLKSIHPNSEMNEIDFTLTIPVESILKTWSYFGIELPIFLLA